MVKFRLRGGAWAAVFLMASSSFATDFWVAPKKPSIGIEQIAQAV